MKEMEQQCQVFRKLSILRAYLDLLSPLSFLLDAGLCHLL